MNKDHEFRTLLIKEITYNIEDFPVFRKYTSYDSRHNAYSLALTYNEDRDFIDCHIKLPFMFKDNEVKNHPVAESTTSREKVRKLGHLFRLAHNRTSLKIYSYLLTIRSFLDDQCVLSKSNSPNFWRSAVAFPNNYSQHSFCLKKQFKNSKYTKSLFAKIENGRIKISDILVAGNRRIDITDPEIFCAALYHHLTAIIATTPSCIDQVYLDVEFSYKKRGRRSFQLLKMLEKYYLEDISSILEVLANNIPPATYISSDGSAISTTNTYDKTLVNLLRNSRAVPDKIFVDEINHLIKITKNSTPTS